MVTSIVLIGMDIFFDILNISRIRIAKIMLRNFHISMNGLLKVGPISNSEECFVLICILLGFHPTIWFRKVEVLKVLLWQILSRIQIVMSLIVIVLNVLVGENLFLLLLIDLNSLLN